MPESRRKRMMPRLQGKVAVITGGSSGLGLATAQRFVREGAFVYLTGRRQNDLDMAAALIGDGVAPVRGDVQNLGDLDHLYETIKQEKGKIDILVANAGFSHSSTRRKRISTRPSAPTCVDFSSPSRRRFLFSAKAAPSS
jgi:NAD(P)-dependent dehydrogenase (short-subunit alcohol dehydrogenase family)